MRRSRTMRRKDKRMFTKVAAITASHANHISHARGGERA